jgi:hypothetical protein
MTKKTSATLKRTLNESKKRTFLDSPAWDAIVRNIQGIHTSDGTLSVLLDFERVLDNADIYAFKNWSLGELVDGPDVRRYDVACTFMWPKELMPDPRGAKRLLPYGCTIEFKKTDIKVPVQIESPDDFKPGTHYPKMVDREVWLVHIVMPKELLQDIREGSIDIADQEIDLEDLDDAYQADYDDERYKDDEKNEGDDMGMGMGAPLGGPGLGMPPAPGGLPGL